MDMSQDALLAAIAAARAEDRPPADLAESPKGAPNASTARGGSKLNKREAAMVERVTGLYMSIGTMLFLVAPQDAQIILQMAPDRATELVKVARHHKRMWAILESLTTGGDYVPLIWGHTQLALALLAAHGKSPLDVVAIFRRKSAEESDDAAASALAS